MVYEGSDKYIFVSYSHKDSQKVLPIINELEKEGFRVWYDSGIEAGTEWPEYIEDHLSRAEVVLAFMSPNAIQSRNCRNEINFALDLQKEILIVYLEETELMKGMRLQLNSTQSLFRKNHITDETFIRELINAQIIQECRDGYEGHKQSERKYESSINISNTIISNVCSIGTNDEEDIWPNGNYTQNINLNEFSVVFFHINLLKPIGVSGQVRTKYQIYNSDANLIFDVESSLDVEPGYDKFSTGWILKGSDGSFIPPGKYRFLCSINNSPTFTYHFSVVSGVDEGHRTIRSKSFLEKLKEIFG